MKPTATAVLDDVDAVLSSAAAARNEATVADIPDLEPIPGPWDIATVLRRDREDGDADYWPPPFDVDGIRYDRQYNTSVAQAWPIIQVRPDFAVGLSAARKSCLAVDLDYNNVVWIYDPVTLTRIPAPSAGPNDKLLALTYRYADEGWVW